MNNPEPVGDELYIRRMLVDEALLKLDKYIDAAFMAGYTEVRVVHGKGGGILRTAVHRALKRHPLVRSFRLGMRGEGSEGVTIVELGE